MRAIATVLAALAVSPAVAGAVEPEYFPLSGSRPVGEAITTTPDGAVWFGAGTVSPEVDPPIGRIDPVTGAMTLYPTVVVAEESCCANIIRDLSYDAVNDRLWYIRSNGVIGHGTTASMVPDQTAGQSAALTPGKVSGGGIAVGPDGDAWFTEYSASNVGPDYHGNRVSSASPSFGFSRLPDFWHQFPGAPDNSRYDAKPRGITIAADGTPWFVEETAGLPGYRIGKVGGADGAPYTEYLLTPCAATGPCSGSNTGTGPVSVAPGPNGSVWFTNVIKNTVGKIEPASGTITQYAMTDIGAALANGQPRSIRRAADGTLWVAQYGGHGAPGANAIVRIVPTDPPTADVYPTGATRFPFAVAPDAKGNVWFTATPSSGGAGAIGRLAGVSGPVATPDPSATATPAPTSTPPPGGTTLTPSTVGKAEAGKPKVAGDKVRITQICVGPPEDKCSLVFLLDSQEYIKGFPGTKANAAAKKKKKQWTTLARSTATLSGGQSKRITIKLNKKGRKLRAKRKFKARLRVIQQLGGGKQRVVAKATVRFKKK